MTPFDELKLAGFDGIDFPYTKCAIRCSLREHIHEFPYTPGGKPELMGRKLYEIDFDCIFMKGAVDPRWSKLWPLDLATLRTKFEQEVVSRLHIPTVGSIQAYCYDWGQVADPAKMRNGETTTFKFREDQSDRFLVTDIIKVSPAAISNLAKSVVRLTAEQGEDVSAWDKMIATVDDVTALMDQAELQSRLLESKIYNLIEICRVADRALTMLKNPVNFEVLDALKTLWAAVVDLSENLTNAQGKMKVYNVPYEMTTSDVAAAVYQDASRGGDILDLNYIPNPFAIPAASKIRYFEDS